MSKNNRRQTASIRNLLITVFIAFMLIAMVSYGAVVYSNWLRSAENTVETLAADTHETIASQIESFLHIPLHVNEMNHLMIENKILDLSDARQREQFFAGVLQSHPEVIYSFSYGTTDGEYYGARRNKSGEIEIMVNNQSTGGESWYYEVNDDLTAGELAVKLGPFDPRSRDWYLAAANSGQPVYSPVYPHFVMEDLSVSAAWPIDDAAGSLAGVMGAHFLLSDINGYLLRSINRYGGQAVVIEEKTGHLIANSMGLDNFGRDPDGTLTRISLEATHETDLIAAFEQYENDQNHQFSFKGSNGIQRINVAEIHLQGVDWLLLSAIPQSFFTSTVSPSMTRASLLAVLTLLILILVYRVLLRRLMKPVSVLLTAASAFREGDLSQRVHVKRRDEIGLISESFNGVAAKMQSLIENLEGTVAERTQALQTMNLALSENRKELRLILDTAAEAIYGIDTKGRCTFCNTSSLAMLGYEHEDELIGREMHELIHHSKADGSPFPVEECRISQSIRLGNGFEADDEVFWCADGTSFDVEYRAMPQMKDGVVVGGVITFIDITDKKKQSREIQYLNQHDALTGLYNRRYFEKAITDYDEVGKLPLSILFADINGLKITNDIFGHEAGDLLIKTTADILSDSCRDKDMIARIGGDEFVILLPNTTKDNAQRILDRIREGFRDVHVKAIKCSIAAGVETKADPAQNLAEILANAENSMYKDKSINRGIVNKDMINTIVRILHEHNTRERQHAFVVESLCGRIGHALELPESDIDKLKRAAFLHDIGKITLDHELLVNDSLTDEEEHDQMQQHALAGYRLLSLIDNTMDLAEYVYHHHEHWDGTGFPKGLAGEQIPLISRIIAIAETYERVLNRTNSLQSLSPTERKRQAIDVIRQSAGTRFDPKIAHSFIQLMSRV